MGHHRLKAAAGASPADPYFSSTSLLLLGNGTNGGQNNTCVDSSTNNFTVTRNGNTTQGSFSPFGYNWGVAFDGSGDYLTVPYSSNLQLGSSDFTIEFFIFFNSVASGQRIVSGDGNSSGTLNWCFYTDSTGTLNYFLSTSGTAWTVSGNLVGNISVGQWYHVALVRNGSTFTPYLKGVAGTTATTSSALYTTTTGITIGAINSGNYFNGNISNLRILKGTAQYTAAFTPPINNLTAITNTQLLTCQSNRFLDNSSNAFAITPYGNAAVTNFAPFPTNSEYSTGVNGGSGYFDGSSDYLSVASDTAFAFGTGDFTVECWVYWNSTSSNADSFVNINASGGFSFYWDGGTYATNKLVVSNRIANQFSETFAPSTGTWYHLVVSRVSSNFRVWVNGTQLGSTATVTTNYAQGDCQIGGTTDGSTWSINGYISSLRIVKGSGVTSVTVPTAPLTAITNTSLLLNFTNASILDSTGKNDLETVGDAQISTSVNKYGTGSLKFDGTGDRLVIPYKADLLLGSGDFTVEMWLYKNANTAYMTACGNLSTANSSAWQVLGDSTGNKIAWYSSSAFQLTSTSSLATSTWHHVAFVRNGTFFKLYLNGTEEASATNSVNFNVTNDLWIGHTPENISGRDWNGYIDDLRITKGVARYTAAFTPPSRQLPSR